jgi:hypothetical protein
MKTLRLLCLVTGSALAAVPNLSILEGASPAGVDTDSQGNLTSPACIGENVRR